MRASIVHRLFTSHFDVSALRFLALAGSRARPHTSPSAPSHPLRHRHPDDTKKVIDSSITPVVTFHVNRSQPLACPVYPERSTPFASRMLLRGALFVSRMVCGARLSCPGCSCGTEGAGRRACPEQRRAARPTPPAPAVGTQHAAPAACLAEGSLPRGAGLSESASLRNSATRHFSSCVSLQLRFLPHKAQLPASLGCAGNKGLITTLESIHKRNQSRSCLESTSYKNAGGPAIVGRSPT